MFHPVNGRLGFDAVPTPVVTGPLPDVGVMIKMLKHEEELRKSERYQNLFANPDLNAVHVAAEAQKEVVTKFGFSDRVDEVVDILRAAPKLYPDHKEAICRIPHYRKFNRSEQGALSVGDPLPDVPLVSLNLKTTTLHKWMEENCLKSQPLVICNGSIT